MSTPYRDNALALPERPSTWRLFVGWVTRPFRRARAALLEAEIEERRMADALAARAARVASEEVAARAEMKLRQKLRHEELRQLRKEHDDRSVQRQVKRDKRARSARATGDLLTIALGTGVAATAVAAIVTYAGRRLPPPPPPLSALHEEDD